MGLLFHVNNSSCKLLSYNMKWALLILSVVTCIEALDLAPEKVADASREGKVFSLFSVVTFPNSGCTSQSGTTGFTGVNRNGTCFTATECSDKGSTSPSGYTAPPIAGMNAGQHIYMDVGPDSGGYITMTFAFSTTTTTISRTWEIHVTQHECSSTSRPFDSGCLQYHTGSAGRFQSFNFAQTTTTLYGHMHSQDYNICIRQEQGACCIKYSLCEDTYSFAIMNNEQSVATGANQGTYCDADHIEITGPKKECGGSNQGADRICGGAFNVEAGNTVSASSLCDCTAPFVVKFSATILAADTKAAPTDQPQRGFCLQYQQVSCGAQP